ncbi:hypothetical protein OM076_42830 [Solirubrobacter ginsenosidimutans]|uniref:Uncharacterized protein n=1 Tax=Solirubrobacter ginsenosidimutans TaxID=490573 RepID=A0A9X3N4R7_9ACTN|nr:hypothetical protein [Solirubrobacter ginsenosidimutans]
MRLLQPEVPVDRHAVRVQTAEQARAGEKNVAEMCPKQLDCVSIRLVLGRPDLSAIEVEGPCDAGPQGVETRVEVATAKVERTFDVGLGRVDLTDPCAVEQNSAFDRRVSQL